MFGAFSGHHIRLGDAARDARDWVNACLHYQRAVVANPRLDGIWVQLGHALKELGDLRGAEAAYHRALALKPGIPDTHLQIGHLMKMSGRLNDAVKAYADAALLDPELCDARTELAALGYSPEGLRVFGVAFDGPFGTRRSAGKVRFEVLARLDGIESAEVLRLVAHRGLRVGYWIHGGCSDSIVEQTGHVPVDFAGRSILLCRFVLPDSLFDARRLRLLRVNMLYEGVGTFSDFDRPGGWLAIDTNRIDLSSHYLALANGRAREASVRS